MKRVINANQDLNIIYSTVREDVYNKLADLMETLPTVYYNKYVNETGNAKAILDTVNNAAYDALHSIYDDYS